MKFKGYIGNLSIDRNMMDVSSFGESGVQQLPGMTTARA